MELSRAAVAASSWMGLRVRRIVCLLYTSSKTTAVRLIPAPGKQVGDTVEFGGLLGSAPVQPVHPFSAKAFVDRGGRIPAPMQSLKN